jgi:ribosomal-protein-alanine acetyltransferase
MKKQSASPLAFTVIWEFRVRRAKRLAFEQAYGPEGDWAQLFRGFDGYLGTDLLRDRATPLRYFSIDRWASRQAFLEMKKKSRAAYRSLDEKCESLTTRERLVGEFHDGCGAEIPVRPSSQENPQLEHSGQTAQREKRGQECPPHTTVVVHVRPATPADIPAIVALERETPSAAHWPEASYRRVFGPDAAPARIALVSESAGRVLHGFVIARLAGDECELENIAVDRKRQRRGLGTQLLQELIAAARAQRAARIFLEVRKSNAAARALYERCGFAIAGRRPSYYTSPSEDAVLYTVAL